jgi:hypothetical protein
VLLICCWRLFTDFQLSVARMQIPVSGSLSDVKRTSRAATTGRQHESSLRPGI